MLCKDLRFSTWCRQIFSLFNETVYLIFAISIKNGKNGKWKMNFNLCCHTHNLKRFPHFDKPKGD